MPRPSPKARPVRPWSKALIPGNIDLARDEAVDPYLAWAYLTHFATFGTEPPTTVSVLFEIVETSRKADGADAFLDKLKVGNPLNERSRFGSADLPRDALLELTEAVTKGWLRRFQLCSPRLDPAQLNPEADKEPQSIGTRTHMKSSRISCGDTLHTLGIVDDGCCFGHESLRPDNRTRLALIWDQDRSRTIAAPWHRLPESLYGAELTAVAINSALSQFPKLGETEERKMYQSIGRPDWGTESRRHGAGVMHVLAKDHVVSVTDQANDPTQLPIYFVQLPVATVADTSGGSIGLHALDGARYVVKRTKELARSLRCADWRTTINLSLGSIAGPHNGTSIAELGLQELGADGKAQVVVAAGNAAGWKTHARRVVTSDQSGEFYVMVPPDNPRETYVEVWLHEPDVRQGQISVEVASPIGGTSSRVVVGQAAVYRTSSTVQASVIFPQRAAQSADGTCVLVAFRPTVFVASKANEGLPYGVWTITIRTRSTQAIDVHAWVERNDTIIGPRRSQRSYFVDEVPSYVSSELTLATLANEQGVAVVGAYRAHDHAITDYSSRGPTRAPGTRTGPDYYGPADESMSLPGIQVPGFFSGTLVRMSGTSIASPRVARWLANGMAISEMQELDSVTSCGTQRPRLIKPTD